MAVGQEQADGSVVVVEPDFLPEVEAILKSGLSPCEAAPLVADAVVQANQQQSGE